MALFHLSVTQTKRSAGQSAIALLALSRKNPFGCNRNRQFELR